MKVLTYNSSARGAGQFVRALKIARVITDAFLAARCIILAGNSRVDRPVPDRTEIVTLPEIRKTFDGDYTLGASAVGCATSPNAVAATFAARKRIIQATIDEYDPDIFLVDTRAAGLNDELLDVLRHLATSKCRTVLMLRDIIDGPEVVARRWAEQDTYRVITDMYDDVVIWGDEHNFDAVTAYALWPFHSKVKYLGYLGSGAIPAYSDAGNEAGTASIGTSRILVTVGGGFDGAGVIATVCDYIRRASPHTSPLSFTMVLGAHSPNNVADLFEGNPWPNNNVEVYRHVPELADLVSAAAVVVSMCGYNTLLELIERRKKIVAVPRSHSGFEQMMRAQVLSGIYDGMWVVPQNVFTADALQRALSSALKSSLPRSCVAMTGAHNLVAFLEREVRLD